MMEEGMELLPRHHGDFRRKEYWDEFFTKRQEKAFEWYGEYKTLKSALQKTTKPKDRVLVVGCGNSDLSSKWAEDGYSNITSMDFSELVIDEMKQKYPTMSWDVMDMTKMSYENESFDCVMDKGALDALMATDDEPVLNDATKMFGEVDRILSPGGSYICITMAQDFIVQHLLTAFSETFSNYAITVHEVPRSKSSPFVPFFVVCTKSTTPVSKVHYNGKFFLHANGESRKQWLLHEMEATQWYIMSQNELKKIQVGRQRVIELMTSASTTLNTTPRYTIRLVDVQQQAPNGSCGVFLVPQGREHEYLFATEEGAMELASGAGFSRFLIVSLGRTHTFASLEAVQLELNPKMMELCPDTLGKNEKIPYMTVQEGLGERQIVAHGTSELSGDYFIEEVDLHRRLVFLSNNNTIQTEIQLLPALSAKQLKEKARKNKKKGIESASVRLRFDPTYLAFEYHKSIAAFLHYYLQAEDPPHQSLLVGLGGGALASYLQTTIPNVSLTACELDPTMVTIAKEYFGLQTNNRLQVVVQDGIELIQAAACASYNSIIFDVDAKSNHEKSVGISAPPQEFLRAEFLKKVYDVLTPHGLFLVNVSCRSKSIYKEFIETMRSIFGSDQHVLELKASEQDVNRIVCGVKGNQINLATWRGMQRKAQGFDEDELENLITLIDVAEP